MALMKCPECGNEISDMAKQCPMCGCPINKRIINDKKHNKANSNEDSANGNVNELKNNNGVLKIAIAIICVSLVGIAVILSIAIVYPRYSVMKQYKTAEKLVSEEEYIEAIEIYKKLGNYKDSEEKVNTVSDMYKYKEACALIEAKDYLGAQDAFLKLKDYKDSQQKAEEAYELYLDSLYKKACLAEENTEFIEAYNLFEELAKKKYKDSAERAEQAYGHIYREEKEIVYLEMGCGHGSTLLYSTGRTLSSVVKAKTTIVYNNDIPDLTNVTIEYYDPDWGGRLSGWSLKHVKLVGRFPKILEGVVDGTGQLYTYGEKNWQLAYDGGFSGGKYTGSGKIYWEESLGGGILCEGTFKNGNLTKYTRYYSDGRVNDSGTISELGVGNSPKWGISDYYDDEVIKKFDKDTQEKLKKNEEFYIK